MRLFLTLSLLFASACVYAAAPDSQLYTFQLKSARINTPSPIKTGTCVSPDGHTLGFGTIHFTRDSEPWYPIMGEMHFSRIPETEWEESILKMRNCGIEVISTYIFWNHHEEVRDEWDFSGRRNLRAFLELCAKNHMMVYVRIGPWCHGEARNGGFPDYIQKGPKRNNNPAYLERVKVLFSKIAEQCDKMYYKDGGPIIGIQYENEFDYSRPEGYKHMLNLYNMAQELGMDAPFHSATLWPAAGTEAREFLTPMGCYASHPWKQSIQPPEPLDVFLYRELTPDPAIGADLMTYTPKNTADLMNIMPIMTAEQGGGNQVCYHRRPLLGELESLAMAYVSFGSGVNSMGYYMFHGGVNPPSKHYTLQESRATKYPNDCPVINYDFQSPIGSEGQINPPYKHFRLFHGMLKTIGTSVIDGASIRPTPAPKKDDVSLLRCAYRGSDDNGALVFSNIHRRLQMKTLENVQFKMIQSNGKSFTIPQKGIAFPPNSFGAWLVTPNLYVTATPFDLDPFGQVMYFYASPGMDVEVGGAALKGFKYVVDPEAVVFSNETALRVKNGITLDMTNAQGFRMVILPYEKALNTYQHGRVTVTGDYDWVNPGFVVSTVYKRELLPDTVRLFDTFTTPEGINTYHMELPENLLDDDVLLEIDYVGDTACLYAADLPRGSAPYTLINDDYNYGRTFLTRLKRHNLRGKDLKIDISPISRQQKTWFEESFQKTIPEKPTAVIKSVRLYRLVGEER